jgi:protein-disulfide isomerase
MSTDSPTKRELREQRRAERLVAEQATAARATRRRRVWLLLGAVGVAAVAVAAAVVISSSSSSSTSSDKAARGSSVTSAASMFAGIPEKNGVLGDPKAPITVTEYVDLQCPVCAEASHATMPTLIKKYVRAGKIKLDARTLSFLGPDSVSAAKVAAGAEKQGKLWPFVETFYANQGEENSGYATDAFLRQIAGAAGVNADAALGQKDSAFAAGRLNRANNAASALGVNGTPTLTIRRGNGSEQVLKVSPLDTAAVEAALDKELAK